MVLGKTSRVEMCFKHSPSGQNQNLASRNMVSNCSNGFGAPSENYAPISRPSSSLHHTANIFLMIFTMPLLTLNTFWSCICSSAESLGKSMLFLHNIWYPRVILRQEKMPMRKSANISIEFVSFRTAF